MQSKKIPPRAPNRPAPRLAPGTGEAAKPSQSRQPALSAAKQREAELAEALASWVKNLPQSEHEAANAFRAQALQEAAANVERDTRDKPWVIECPYGGPSPTVPPHLQISIVAVGPPPDTDEIPPPPPDDDEAAPAGSGSELSQLERMTQALQVTMSHSLTNRDIGALATTSRTMHREMAPLTEQRRVQAERVKSLGQDDPLPRKIYIAGRQTEKFIRLEENGGISWGHTEDRRVGERADYFDYKDMPHADFRVVHSLSAEHVDQMRRAILWGNRPYTPTELIKEISRMATVDPNNYNCYSIVSKLQSRGIPFSTSEERVPDR